MIISFYNTVFYEPLLNGLIFLIDIMPAHDIGLAVILLTIIVRFIIFPFQHRAVVTQRKMRDLEPDLKKIKEKHKKDNQEQAKKTMELYKQHGINPFSGFLVILVQLPVFIALYKIFMAGANFDQSHIYSFIALPETVKINFLGLVDMAQKSYVLAFLAGATQFFQMKLAIPPIKKGGIGKGTFSESLAKSMSLQAKYVMPIFIFFIGLSFSSAIALYWTTMNIFAILHEVIVAKKAKKNYEQSIGNNQTADRGDIGQNER